MPHDRRQQLYDWFTARPRAVTALRRCNSFFTALVYLVYIGLVVVLMLGRDARIGRVVMVPALVFISGTFLRAKLDRPRPYENGGLPPLLDKDTQGRSFPSRHVFSSTVISLAVGYVCPAGGFAMLVVTLLVAALRVVGGVHWLRDVLAGLAWGGLLGWLGFYIL